MKATEPFTIERVFDAPAIEVWKAITERDRMQEWYFKLKEFKPEVDFEFSFEGGQPGKVYVHLCKVTEVIPGKKITYSWKYKGYEGISFVTWELFTEKDKTKLKLTHAGLETLPDIADFARKNFEEGWTMIIGKQLPEYLETKLV